MKSYESKNLKFCTLCSVFEQYSRTGYEIRREKEMFVLWLFMAVIGICKLQTMSLNTESEDMLI